MYETILDNGTYFYLSLLALYDLDESTVASKYSAVKEAYIFVNSKHERK